MGGYNKRNADGRAWGCMMDHRLNAVTVATTLSKPHLRSELGTEHRNDDHNNH